MEKINPIIDTNASKDATKKQIEQKIMSAKNINISKLDEPEIYKEPGKGNIFDIKI